MRTKVVLICVFLLTLSTVLTISEANKPENKQVPNHGIAKGHHKFQRLNLSPVLHGCPQVERISEEITWSRVETNSALPAKLLRLHYHDCFVRGCDASILLNSTGNSTAEKDAGPNRSISGYDVIDEIKAKLEEQCSGKVSCADIVALAARDAVSYQFGKPMWPVLLGRKDGKVSLASEAVANLPSARANFTTLLEQFQSNGLDLADLVALSGAHTIGEGHCVIIASRLFNFTGKNDTDPTINSGYADILKNKCSNPPNAATTVDMDPDSSKSFDSHYYVALNQNKGLFRSDAALLTNPLSAEISKSLENPKMFIRQFAKSMVKMGSIGVITGEDGEIRNKCNVVN